MLAIIVSLFPAGFAMILAAGLGIAKGEGKADAAKFRPIAWLAVGLIVAALVIARYA